MIKYTDKSQDLLIPIKLAYQPNLRGARTFVVIEDINVTLSDGHEITIKAGTVTDLASVPKWAWSIFTPIDEAFLGDLIHDYLWIDKAGQIAHFDNSPYEARKFADEERLKWRKKIAPKKRFKNWLTHKVIRLIGGVFYSRQLKIPN